MRRSKSSSVRKKKLEGYSSHFRDGYRARSSLNISNTLNCSSDDTKQKRGDEVRNSREKDSVKDNQSKNPAELPFETIAFSSLLNTNELVFCEGCNHLRSVSEDDVSKFFGLGEADYDYQVYSSRNMETALPRYKKGTHSYRSNREGFKTLKKPKPRTTLNDKVIIQHSKDIASKVNNDNAKAGGSLPLLKTFAQERAENLNGKIGTLGAAKPGSRGNDEDIGTVNGKKLTTSLSSEFHNLRHFLPLLTLCQCPDYDSAIIEVVRDYNDPCRGVSSHMFTSY